MTQLDQLFQCSLSMIAELLLRVEARMSIPGRASLWFVHETDGGGGIFISCEFQDNDGKIHCIENRFHMDSIASAEQLKEDILSDWVNSAIVKLNKHIIRDK